MKKIKNTRGFTLTELLAIIILTSILIMLALRTMNSNSQKREMFLSNYNHVVTLFKTARNMAMTNEQVNFAGSEPFVPEGGFGVHVDINNKTFTLFADTHNSAGTPNEPNQMYDKDWDVVISNTSSFTITDELIEIKEVKADGTIFATGENEFVVLFKPLEIDVSINKNDGNDVSNLEIIFISPVASRSLSVNKISKYIETKIL